LEEALVKNIRKFLIEMGSAFTFVGNQFCVKVADNEYFIDLLLFHRKLKCLVAIELKIDEFKPEYKGKMEFYLSVLNDKYKEEGENDAIGIIICKEKSRTIVEYSFKNAIYPIGVSTYNTTSLLPEQFKGLLPSPEEILQRFNDLENII
jgi:maltooligosyltrehalose synthase